LETIAMTTHRRSGRKPPARDGPAKAPRAPAALRRRWLLAAGILLVAAAGGILVVVERSRPNRPPPVPIPPAPPPPQSAASQPGPTKVELSPQEKAAALKEQELRFAEQLVKEFPDSEEPLVLLGDVHRRRGHIDQSVSLWEQALRRNPRRNDVYDRLARLAFETDEYEKAVGLWRQALQIDPVMPRAHIEIAKALMALGKYEESIPEIREEIKLSPGNAVCYCLLGQACQHCENYEEARQNYERAVALQPYYSTAHYGLYTLYTRLKDSEKARQHLAQFKKAKEREDQLVRQRDRLQTDLTLFSKGLARVCVGAHELYRQAGNGARMEAMLKQAVELDPNNVVPLEKLVAAYRVTNRVPEALALCRRIEQIDPNNTACQLNIGRLSALLRRFDDAEKAIRKVIALLPDHYSGYQELARLYLVANRNLPQAKELAQKAVELDPVAENYFVLGWATDVNGDPNGAMAAVEKALALSPDNRQYKEACQQIRSREEAKRLGKGN
jgi:tetratricopeptide (TPR) repeat protein